MRKKRTKPKPNHQGHRRPAKRGRSDASEDMGAVGVTVAWVTCTLATLGAELLGALGLILRNWTVVDASQPNLIAALPSLMLLISAVTGLIGLALTPAVYRFRRVPPPSSVTAVAVTVFLLPLAVMLFSQGR